MRNGISFRLRQSGQGLPLRWVNAEWHFLQTAAQWTTASLTLSKLGMAFPLDCGKAYNDLPCWVNAEGHSFRQRQSWLWPPLRWVTRNGIYLTLPLIRWVNTELSFPYAQSTRITSKGETKSALQTYTESTGMGKTYMSVGVRRKIIFFLEACFPVYLNLIQRENFPFF